MGQALIFHGNDAPTVGTELELMLLDPATLDLKPAAVPIQHLAQSAGLGDQIKLEITQSMIELNSSPHLLHSDLEAELIELGRALQDAARASDALICGGGTHPFHRWQERRLSPSARFLDVGQRFGYLAKQITVFGQHVHAAVADGDEAIAVSRRLAIFVPHFIALAASSPFHRSTDTSYDSCRLNALAALPLTGCMPRLRNWSEFSAFFARLKHLGIAGSVKDLYWDVRPKPETGTVELRVLDTPLDPAAAADLAAYMQVLTRWCRRLRLPEWLDEYVYRHNRFQATRYGLDGQLVIGRLGERLAVRDHVRYTLDRAAAVAGELGCEAAFERIARKAESRSNDATQLREWHAQTQSFHAVVSRANQRWEQSLCAVQPPTAIHCELPPLEVHAAANSLS